VTQQRNVVVIAFVALLVVGATVALWLWHSVRTAAMTPGAASIMQEVDVPQGASLRAVLRDLEERELIRSAQQLEWYLRCCWRGDMGKGIKAGRYRFLPGEHPLAILRNMVDGRVVTERVTILEGWSFAQMRNALTKARELRQTVADHTEQQIMQELGVPDVPAEGRFAPDTYAYAPGVTTDLQIIRLAYEAQRRNLQEAWDTRQGDLPLKSAEEALVLASIVEKETGLASERARVAGVFVNRLRLGMRLQSDPTVIYGMRERYDGNIRRSDLERDSPWNTYTRAGLPPTPIALPGRDAIIATLNPDKTDALFFVAAGDGSGGHYFSATLAEHNRAVSSYLDRLRERALSEAWAEVNAENAGTSPDAPVAPATPAPATP
jgi:UPF0755 protein